MCISHLDTQMLLLPTGTTSSLRLALSAVCQTVYWFLALSQVSFMTLLDLYLPLTSRPLLISRLLTQENPYFIKRIHSIRHNLPDSQPCLPTSHHALTSLPVAAEGKVALLFRANSFTCAIDNVLKLSLKMPLSYPCS